MRGRARQSLVHDLPCAGVRVRVHSYVPLYAHAYPAVIFDEIRFSRACDASSFALREFCDPPSYPPWCLGVVRVCDVNTQR